MNPTRRKAIKIGSGLAGGHLIGTNTVTAQEENTSSRQRWVFNISHDAIEFIVGSPIVFNESIFIADRGGYIYSINSTTGEKEWEWNKNKSKIWQLRYSKDSPNSDSPFFKNSLAVVDNTIFASGHHYFYAIDADTGNELWTIPFEGGYSSPTVVDGTIFVGSADANLYAIDAESGSKEWTFKTDGEIYSSPTVADELVFVGSEDNTLYAIDTETGTKEWAFETDGNISSSPTIANGLVFVGSDDKNLYAIDAENGAEQWSFQTGANIESSPTVANETVIFGSRDGNLYAVNLQDGTEKWVFRTDITVRINMFNSSPTVANGCVFVGNKNFRLYAIEIKTGEEKWAFKTSWQISTSSPVVENGTVYIGNLKGNLYAIDADINGSSTDSRVDLGTLGYHEEWRYVGQSLDVERIKPSLNQSGKSSGNNATGEQSENESSQISGGSTTFFDFPTGDAGSTGILAGSLLGAGYLVKKWRDSDDESESTTTEPNWNETSEPTIESTTEPDIPTNLSYSDIDTTETMIDTDECVIQASDIPAHNLSTWVITPGGSTSETIDTTTTKDFYATIEQWANVDTHEYLTAVYGFGADPLPWVATEPADGQQLGGDFSIRERLDYLTHVCEAVHHISRYGVVYENLNPESILINGEGDLQLRGVIDEFNASDVSPYQPPEDTEVSSHDAGDVYRVGAVAYEILTGEQPTTDGNLSPPSTVNPDLPAEIDSIIMKAMAETPEERYETVLHLRDALSEV
jgi:outer membrane protein assembly factor BamB